MYEMHDVACVCGGGGYGGRREGEELTVGFLKLAVITVRV